MAILRLTETVQTTVGFYYLYRETGRKSIWETNAQFCFQHLQRSPHPLLQTQYNTVTENIIGGRCGGIRFTLNVSMRKRLTSSWQVSIVSLLSLYSYSVGATVFCSTRFEDVYFFCCLGGLNYPSSIRPHLHVMPCWGINQVGCPSDKVMSLVK